MKSNTLSIYTSLIILSFFVPQSLASDNVNKEKFNSIFAREIGASHNQTADDLVEIDQASLEKMKSISSHKDQPEVNQLWETMIRERITRDKETVDWTNDHSIINFIFDCKENHFLLTDYPKDEADLDFYQTEDYFQAYLGDHWCNDEQLRKCWFWYHLKGAIFFKGLSNFTEAENSLIKANEIDAVELRKSLGSFVGGVVQEWNAVNEQILENNRDIDASNRHFILCQYATLYENVRRSQGAKEFDCIDNITISVLCLFGHDNEKGIEFGLKALEGSWPDRKDPFFRMQSSPERLKRAMASAYYELKQFDKAAQFYFEVPQSDLTIECYKNISCIYGSLGLWEESFKYFKIFQDLSSNQTGLLFSLTEEEAITLIKMLMKQSAKDFNTYGKDFIQVLKRYVPPVEKDIELLMRYVREKKEAESNRIIRNAIAQQRFESIRMIYQSFDHQYQNLWAHGSLLPFETGEDHLCSLNKIAQKIEKNYNALVLLKSKGSYADNISTILELIESLKKNIAHFSSQVKELNYQISKMRRQLYKEYPQSVATERESFTEFKPSLKAQTLSEQKQKESEAKLREEKVVSKKQARKGERANLSQVYQEKSQKEVSTKGTNTSPAPVQQSSICSFKDKDLQYLWEHQKENLLPNVLEMLGALHEAKSIFQLRTLLTPGAKLEILTGDREGQISLRVNDQYRLCFYWVSGEGAYGVELVDYHH